mmetsp:Transcript_80499/g.218188  ORF Transcript_80499/g.218188 Transcript_80499/m.218188 type:complete len:238 (-) Transcript_80499:75-788(-)
MSMIELDVRWLSGESLVIVSADPTWTVAQLLEHLQPHFAEAARLRLVARQTALENGQTLEASGLVNGSIVHAVVSECPLDKPLVKIMLEQRHLTDDEVCVLISRAESDHINTKDQELTALHLAADRGLHLSCCALLNNNVFTEANARDGVGFAALHWAAISGHLAACQALLDHERFVEAGARNVGGQTALHVAASCGHAEVCRLIRGHERFTASEARDNRGRTALDVASGLAWEVFR